MKNTVALNYFMSWKFRNVFLKDGSSMTVTVIIYFLVLLIAEIHLQMTEGENLLNIAGIDVSRQNTNTKAASNITGDYVQDGSKIR